MKFRILKKGFSLIELSVVILVISVVVAGLLSVQTSGNITKKNAATNYRINQVYKALKIFAGANKRLPCPAPITLAASDVSYGEEGDCTAATGVYVSGNLVYGMLPIKALKISPSLALDDFGNKFAYIVDSTFTTSSSPSGFIDPNEGGIAINKYFSSLILEEPSAIFAIISYGKNQKGGVSAFATTANSSSSSDVDELENAISGFDANLISATSRSGTSFDDVVFFKNKKNFLQDAGLQFYMGDNNQTGSAISSGLEVCTITGVSGFNDKTSLALTETPTEIPSPCQSGYSGSPTYTCLEAGEATISGTCSAGCYASNGTNDYSTVPGSAIHTFTSNGSLVCNSTSGVQILVVAAGGSGGGTSLTTNNYGAGGGGGGEVIYVPNVSLSSTTYNIVVAGTTPGKPNDSCNGRGNNGGSSSFIEATTAAISITAKGGGGGGGCGNLVGNSGGSGGGGGRASVGGGTSNGIVIGVTGAVKSVSSGGATTSVLVNGGGGGGASRNPGNSANGGQGIAYNISGTSRVYGSGGGANSKSSAGSGGTNAGNGVVGTNVDSSGSSHAINGFGGGGGGNARPYYESGRGGSGIVIVRYVLP